MSAFGVGGGGWVFVWGMSIACPGLFVVGGVRDEVLVVVSRRRTEVGV